MQEAQVRPPWKAKVGREDLSPPPTLNWQLEVKGLRGLIEPALEGDTAANAAAGLGKGLAQGHTGGEQHSWAPQDPLSGAPTSQSRLGLPVASQALRRGDHWPLPPTSCLRASGPGSPVLWPPIAPPDILSLACNRLSRSANQSDALF